MKPETIETILLSTVTVQMNLNWKGTLLQNFLPGWNREWMEEANNNEGLDLAPRIITCGDRKADWVN